jgi:hypothetical protein
VRLPSAKTQSARLAIVTSPYDKTQSEIYLHCCKQAVITRRASMSVIAIYQQLAIHFVISR